MVAMIRNGRCEGLVNPLGIDAEKPRLSWIYEGENPEGLPIENRVTARSGDQLWDSGWREDGQTAMIYGGEPLCSAQRVEWKSFTRLAGRPETTAESEWYFFETGLLRPEDWHGEWIQAAMDWDAPMLARHFELDSKPKTARVYISGLGFFELYINGFRIGEEVLQPVYTCYGRQPMTHMLYPYAYRGAYRVCYRTFDITDALRVGHNKIEVRLAGGWYVQKGRLVEGDLWYGDRPILLLEARIDDTTIVSDTQWYGYKGVITRSNLFYGEKHDLRSGWIPAMRAETAPAPEGVLRAQMTYSDIAAEGFGIARALDGGDGALIVDFGQNLSGWVETRAEALSGDRLTLRFSEELDANGGMDYDSAGGTDQIQTDEIIFAGGPVVRDRPRFCWHGFRYACVTLERDGKCVPLKYEKGFLEGFGFHAELTARFVSAGNAVTGSFRCDSEILNWYHNASVMSMRSNQHCGVPLDCPHRERLGYTGDGQVTADVLLLNQDAAPFLNKWLDDILDCQNRRTGHITHTAPFYNGGGGPGGWGGAVVFVPWSIYRYSGDKRVLKRAWPAMRKWMTYLDAHSENGIVTSEEKGGWCLGDWCTPEKIEIEPELVNTALTIRMLEIMISTAELLGEANGDLKRSLEERRKAFVRAFRQADGRHYGVGKQGSEALALWSGAVPEEERSAVLEAMREDIRARDWHFDTGIFATPVTVELLSACGFDEDAFRMMTAEGFPSFDFWRQNGATTLWENWSRSASHNHVMFAAADKWLYERAAGLAQAEDSAGWKRIVFRPGRIVGLNEASCSVETPLGRCAVSWKREAEGIRIRMEVPAAVQAEMETPDGDRIPVPAGVTERML